jgi:sec-independent protein translocase protein TatA
VRRPVGVPDFGAKTMILAFGPFGIQALLSIFFSLVLLFGATKLPQNGRGIGEGIRNLKSGLTDDEAQPVLDKQPVDEKGRPA